MLINSEDEAIEVQYTATKWLASSLFLKVHEKNNIVIPVKHGIHFLGHQIYPTSNISIDHAMRRKVMQKIDHRNAGSYKAMHLPYKLAKQLPWFLVK